MPVRKVKQMGKNIIGGIPSRKIGRMVHFESLIEETYIHLLEFMPDVMWYEEQPCTIRYRYQKRDRQYTPDFLVQWADKHHTLIECKPAVYLSAASNLPKWNAAQLFCAIKGWTFSVVTDELLRPYAVLLDNLRFLRSHAHAIHSLPIQDILVRTVAAEGPLSIAELMRRCPQLDPILDRTYVLQLLYTGVFTADLTRSFHLSDTIVAFTGGRSCRNP